MCLGGFKGQPAFDGADRPKEVWIFEPDDFVGHGFGLLSWFAGGGRQCLGQGLHLAARFDESGSIPRWWAEFIPVEIRQMPVSSLPPEVSGFPGWVWPHRMRLWDAVKKDSSPGFGGDVHGSEAGR